MSPGLPLRWLALALSVAACAGIEASPGSTGTGAGGASGCQTSACVAALSMPVSWDIEIAPTGTSATALTELPKVPLGAGPLTLIADSQRPVNATFVAGGSGTVPSIANVVLTYPPLIGGRPDPTFEASSTVNSTTNTVLAVLSVPAAASGRSGALELVPLSPADQQNPPTSFPVTVPVVGGSTLMEPLPATYLSIGGTLLSAIGAAPTATFIARAFQAGTQVSNAPLTGADGSFQLLMAPTAAGAPVIVELTPQNQNGPDPWYASNPVDPTAKNLAPIMLPAYSNPNSFALTVAGADGPAVSGAFVRAQAILGSSAAGATDYLRAGTTSADGTVTLSLVPGTATQARDYDLTVIPPVDSPYATHCISPVGVTVGGASTSPASLLTVTLARRPILTGTVRDASGIGVPHIAITATAGSAPTDVCANTPASSSSLIADGNGRFKLPLDPGTYQLDYDPPAGSAAPRLTELAVVIPADVAEIAHDVTLATAALVEGTVYDAPGPGGAPVPSATVRIFEVRCTSQAGDCSGPARTPPWLRGVTTTDASGRFRVVVPVPAVGN